MSSKRAIRRKARRKACSGKTRFSTFGEARAAMRALILKVGNDGWPMSPYRCTFCGGFHFGHTPIQAILARGNRI